MHINWQSFVRILTLIDILTWNMLKLRKFMANGPKIGRLNLLKLCNKYKMSGHFWKNIYIYISASFVPTGIKLVWVSKFNIFIGRLKRRLNSRNSKVSELEVCMQFSNYELIFFVLDSKLSHKKVSSTGIDLKSIFTLSVLIVTSCIHPFWKYHIIMEELTFFTLSPSFSQF